MKSLSLTRQFTLLVGLLVLITVGLTTLGVFGVALNTSNDEAISRLYEAAGLPLAVMAVLATLGMAALAGWFMHMRMKPLNQLTTYARSMGQGDLHTPIDLQTGSAEVASLAQVLDKTRAQLLQNVEAVSEARLLSETLIQSVVEGIITCDVNWRIVFFSAGASRISGWTSADASGKALDEVLPLSNDEGGHFADYLPMDSGRRTVVARHRSGGTITLAVTRAKQIVEGQTTIVIHDISEETRRRKAQTYFLASMSHEFRTPLAGMQASIELLQENLRQFSVEETQQLLNSIHLSLSMLHQLIDNLLESSKLEANHFTLNRRASEVEPLLGAAIRLIEPMIARRDQRLTLEEPLVLPMLRVDPTRTIQMIVNLLSNASKYSPVGSMIEIWIQQENEGDPLRISIADRGRGINPDKQMSIFMPFVRLEPESQSDHGSGLGLSVVKAIAEAHQGQVGVEARAGGGSVFWFTLPILESEARKET